MKRGASVPVTENSHTDASTTKDASDNDAKLHTSIPTSTPDTVADVVDDVIGPTDYVIGENSYKSKEPAKKKVKTKESGDDNDGKKNAKSKSSVIDDSSSDSSTESETEDENNDTDTDNDDKHKKESDDDEKDGDFVMSDNNNDSSDDTESESEEEESEEESEESEKEENVYYGRTRSTSKKVTKQSTRNAQKQQQKPQRAKRSSQKKKTSSESSSNSNNNKGRGSSNNKNSRNKRKKEKIIYDTSSDDDDFESSSSGESDEYTSESDDTSKSKTPTNAHKGRQCYCCDKRLDLIHCEECDKSFHLKCLEEQHKSYYKKCVKEGTKWTCPICRGIPVPKTPVCVVCYREIYPTSSSYKCAHCGDMYHMTCTKHKSEMPSSMLYSLDLWKKYNLEWHCERCSPHICEICHKKTTRELQCAKCRLYFHEVCADHHNRREYVCKLCSEDRAVEKILLHRKVEASDQLSRRKRRMQSQQSQDSQSQDNASQSQEMKVENEEEEEKKDTSTTTTSSSSSLTTTSSSLISTTEDINKRKGITKDELEYFIKWKDMSHMHDEWVNERWLYQTVKASFNKYQHKHVMTEGDEFTRNNEKADYDNVMENIQSLWTKVDRVMAYEKVDRSKIRYLVKWKGLGYEECEWEDSANLKEFKKEIDEYYARNDYDAVMKLRGHKKNGETRGKRGSFKELKENPPYLPLKLYDYQLEGVNWLLYSWHKGRNTILADEMGLGKTITTIAFLSVLRHALGESGPCIVIVPLSTVPNWEREFRMWAPDFNVVTFLGNEIARNDIIECEFWFDGHERTGQPKFDVVLTTYDMMLFASQALRRITWTQLIIDEGHRLKNRKSKLFEQLKEFKTVGRMILTGTPIQNDLEELFNLLCFLQVKGFDDPEELYTTQFESLEEKEVIDKLHSLIRPHMLRRLKEDVFKDLPEKEEYLVPVDLTSVQKKYYRAVLTRDYALLRAAERTKTNSAATKLLHTLSVLQKVCNHPYLLEGTEPVGLPPEEEFSRMVEVSGKLNLTMRMLVKLFDQGHKVLIFSQMTTMLDILDDCINYKGWHYGRIDGRTPSIDRQRTIDEFNRPGSTMCVLLLSTRAGGLGINLATADTVIIYDSDWNPHNDAQALSRAHRIGQKNKVMVYQLVSRHTVEEKIIERARSKLLLEHLVVQKMKDEFKKGELDELLRYGAKHLFDDEDDDDSGTNSSESVGDGKTQDGSAAEEKGVTTKKKSESEHSNTFTDAEIDKLLDRTRGLDEKTLAEQKEAAEAKAAADNKYFGGFKTARVWVTEEEEEKAAAAEAKEKAEGGNRAENGSPADGGDKDDNFWENLLKKRYLALQEAEAKERELSVRSSRLKKVSYSETRPKRQNKKSAQDDSSSTETDDDFMDEIYGDDEVEDNNNDDDDFVDADMDDDDYDDDDPALIDDLDDEDYGEKKTKAKKHTIEPVTLTQTMGKLAPKIRKHHTKKHVLQVPVASPTMQNAKMVQMSPIAAAAAAQQSQKFAQNGKYIPVQIGPQVQAFVNNLGVSPMMGNGALAGRPGNIVDAAAFQNSQGKMFANNVIVQNVAKVANLSIKAREAFESANALAPSRAFAGEKVAGDKCMGECNYKNAIAHYTAARSICPNEDSILYYRARAYTAEGMFLEALNDLIALVRKQKDHADAYILMVHIYACAGPTYEAQMKNVLGYMTKAIPNNVNAINSAKNIITNAGKLHSMHRERQRQLHFLKIKEKAAMMAKSQIDEIARKSGQQGQGNVMQGNVTQGTIANNTTNNGSVESDPTLKAIQRAQLIRMALQQKQKQQKQLNTKPEVIVVDDDDNDNNNSNNAIIPTTKLTMSTTTTTSTTQQQQISSQQPPSVTSVSEAFSGHELKTKLDFIEACKKAGFVRKKYPPLEKAKLKPTINTKRSSDKVNESLLLARKGEKIVAFSCAAEAIELDNWNPVAYINNAMFLAMNNALKEALENCKIGICLDETSSAYNLLSAILIQANEPKDAIEYGLLNAVEFIAGDSLDKETEANIFKAINTYKKKYNN